MDRHTGINAEPASKHKTREHYTQTAARRRKIQLGTWTIAAVVMIGGLFQPLLGFAVPAVMLTGMALGAFKGRYMCGWLCPRGALFDRIVSRISPKKPIPGFLRSYWLRAGVFAALIGLMVFQISLNPADIYHWGRVFVRICIITSGVGILLAVFIHPRTWCAFCPIGTFQSAVGGHKTDLRLDPSCVGCRVCEKSCAMSLRFLDDLKAGKPHHRDCISCAECQAACPKNALHFS